MSITFISKTIDSTLHFILRREVPCILKDILFDLREPSCFKKCLKKMKKPWSDALDSFVGFILKFTAGFSQLVRSM